MTMIPPALLDADEPRLDKGFEWIDGNAVEKPMGAESGLVTANLTYSLNLVVRPAGLGYVFNSETGYQIFPGKPKQVRKPDLTFVARGRFPNDVIPRGNVRIPPDLAVEVISPNDIAEDFEERVDELMAAGVRLFWMVYPKTRSVWVLRKDGTANRLGATQDLSGEDVVPGFTCPVATLFDGL